MLTPSQTVGPYLGLGLPWEDGPVADPDGTTITGIVYDGAGTPVCDALIETWSPEPRAFARAATDDDGRYAVTVPVPADGYLRVNVFARGLLHRLVTRMYLDGEPPGPPERRDTLRVRDGRFDIHLQGDKETVFFGS